MSIDNWLAAIVDIGKQLDTLQQHIAIDRHGFNKLVREAEAAKEKVRQLTAEVGELRVEREQAEQPRPEPMLGMRDWLVNRGDPTWLRHIIGRNWTGGYWRYSYDYYGPHGEGRAHGIQISDKHWLPIPPRPETPEGGYQHDGEQYELAGEVRTTKGGEYFADGLTGVLSLAAGKMGEGHSYGGRRWILRKVEPEYRKGQLVREDSRGGRHRNQIGEYVGPAGGDYAAVRVLTGEDAGRTFSWCINYIRPAVPGDLTAEQWKDVFQAELYRKEQP